MPDVTITPSEDGPYIVAGPVTLVAPDGVNDAGGMLGCGAGAR